MVPLTEADAADADAVGQPKSSTQFFAIPQPKRKTKPIEEPSAPPPSAAPPGPGAGQMPGMPPPGSPGSNSMAPGMGMGIGMGIQGPVAGGPVAPPQGYPQHAAMPPDHGAGMDGNRAQSYRVFAIVAALMLMVFSALIITVGMTVAGVYMTSNANEVGAAQAPRPAPKSRGPVVDTGVQAPDPKPVPKKPVPRTGGGTSKPRPAPGPAPAPVAPPPPVNAPGAVTVIIPGSETFTSIEVKCPDGFRQRGSFAGGKATVAAVPAMECDVIFKGGLPARNKIRGGQTLNCTFNGGQAVCN